MDFIAIDVGNNFIKILVVCNHVEDIIILRETDELLRFLNENKTKDFIVIISDVRNIDSSLFEYISGFKKVLIMKNNLRLPIEIEYENKDKLGSDRIANAVGAVSLFNNSEILIIDAGTAITIDVIINKVFKGGAILPGLQTMFNSLFQNTKALPLISFNKNEENFYFPAKNTEDCIKVGIIKGVEYQIIGFIDYFLNIFPNGKIILTGGDSDYLEKLIKRPIFVDKFLALKGLIEIAKINL